MRAFISVYDKTGIIEFAAGLKELGCEIISTGGTAQALRQNGIAVTDASEVTNFPECLDGRVKTLHPNIHAGILANRKNELHMETLRDLEIQPIDIVVVNLYPFKQTVKSGAELHKVIENIDIGGPSMLRAAAKNYSGVIAVCDPQDYVTVLQQLKSGSIDERIRFSLCAKVFECTAAYDALIAQYLAQKAGRAQFPDALTLTFEKRQELRYGENPHQQAAFYQEVFAQKGTISQAEQLWGKELSYNNISDADAALDTLREFSETTAIALKHGNPCGVGCDESLLGAYSKAYEADPVSIYGGVVATNAPVDEAAAMEMSKTFLEIIIAPGFTREALEILQQKSNLRLLRVPSLHNRLAGTMEMKKVAGGLLVQEMDTQLLNGEPRVVSKRQPTTQELHNAILAFKVVKHVKSNAIVVSQNGRTCGIGAGQVSRIWATEQALAHSKTTQGASLASDAFFPFDDCVRLAAKYGITCIIEPGGSVRDQDSIDACDELGISLLFTGVRHFRH